MISAITPINLVVIALAGWLNRHQGSVIDYLIAENRILKEQLGDRRIRFSDRQRIQLAVKARILGRQLLNEMDTLVTPGTACLASNTRRQEVELQVERAAKAQSRAGIHGLGHAYD